MERRGQGSTSLLSAEQLSYLTRLGLYYNEPELAIIYVICGFAIKPGGDRVSRHLGEKHGIPKSERRHLNSFIRSLGLSDPATLSKRLEGCHPHPHLVLQRGAQCRHCGTRSSSRDVLLRHLKSVHGYDTRQLQLADHIEDGLAF
jgi:hypothetical protein